MTSPDGSPQGEVERVPLKVVPIYVQPLEDEPAIEPDDDVIVEDLTPTPRRRPVWAALAAILLALGTVAVHVSAIVVASGGDFVTGTTLGYVAIGLSVVAVVVAIAAVVIGRWRWWALAAGLLAVLANPWVLLTVLRFLSGLQTA